PLNIIPMSGVLPASKPRIARLIPTYIAPPMMNMAPGTEAITAAISAIADSGNQCGLTSSHALPMNSQDRNSPGTATVVGNGGLTIGAGGVANSAASSGSEAAATAASAFLRMSVCA